MNKKAFIKSILTVLILILGGVIIHIFKLGEISSIVDNFQNGDKPIIFTSLFLILSIGYFLFNTIGILYDETSVQHSNTGKGAIPVVSSIYMMLTIVNVMLFVGCLDKVLNTVEFCLRNNLAANRAYMDIELKYYIVGGKLMFISVFCAFICNFCKSFFTLTSLEYGQYRTGLNLRIIFDSKTHKTRKIVSEVILRIIIVTIFIILEIDLVSVYKELDVTKSSIDLSKIGNFLTIIGVKTIWLYIFTSLWLIFMSFNTKKFDRWFWLSLVQFAGGAIVSICLILTGKELILDTTANPIVLDKLMLSFFFVVLASFAVVCCIGINEYRS